MNFDETKALFDHDIEATANMDDLQRQCYLDKMLVNRSVAAMAEVLARQNAGRTIYKIVYWWTNLKQTVRGYFKPVTALWTEFKSLYTWAKERVKHENAKSL